MVEVLGDAWGKVDRMLVSGHVMNRNNKKGYEILKVVMVSFNLKILCGV